MTTNDNVNFLTVTEAAKEREIEQGLLTHLRDLLLELGRGFSFVGSQVPLTVDGQTFYIDLLFYHVHLHRYFVFELKVGAFQPEHAGNVPARSQPDRHAQPGKRADGPGNRYRVRQREVG